MNDQQHTLVLEGAEPVVRQVDGGVEITGHIGDGSPLFTVLHAPSGSDRGLLVCSPIYAEFLQNYGREVRLSRRLADAGVASARLHYRGSGDSGGHAADTTFESMVRDALDVADELRARAGIGHLDVLGTRIGGHVAAAVAARLDDARLIVWEPVPEVSRYFDEVLRARRMVGVVSSDDAGSDAASMIGQILDAGSLDVLGYDVHKAMYSSLLDLDIASLLDEVPPRDVLLVQTSRTGTIKGPVSRLADRLGAHGHRVTIESVPPGEGWWIHDYDEEKSPTARREAEQQLLSATEAWVRSAAT